MSRLNNHSNSFEQLNEESTIINEDSFEINNSINPDIENKNNSEKENNSNQNKILVKDVTEEEQLRFDFQKQYKKYKFDKSKDFLERMDIDINKRKCMNNIMEKFIEESKFKVNEVKKIKTFNRLIEDSNRRYEAYDKMMEFLEDEDNKNNELLKMELNKENKKYNEKEWNKIYEQRFLKYMINKQKNYIKGVVNNLKEEIDEYEEEKPLQIHKKIKNKSEAKRIIDRNVKNLYNDYLIRKQKQLNKEKQDEKLMNKKNKLVVNEKLNKIKRFMPKSPNKNKKIYSSNDINGINNIANNNLNQKQILKKSNTPKFSKTRNSFTFSKTDKKKGNKNSDKGNLNSEFLINKFFMNHEK